jgi:hypothetical protein
MIVALAVAIQTDADIAGPLVLCPSGSSSTSLQTRGTARSNDNTQLPLNSTSDKTLRLAVRGWDGICSTNFSSTVGTTLRQGYPWCGYRSHVMPCMQVGTETGRFLITLDLFWRVPSTCRFHSAYLMAVITCCKCSTTLLVNVEGGARRPQCGVVSDTISLLDMPRTFGAVDDTNLDVRHSAPFSGLIYPSLRKQDLARRASLVISGLSDLPAHCASTQLSNT